MARPAGLPCGALGAPSVITRGSSSPNATYGPATSPTRPIGMAAEVAPVGWNSKEATVHATHAEPPAGLDSVVDNTMRLKPLGPRYGKTREITPAEVVPKMRVLAPDLLLTTKGLNPSSLPVVPDAAHMGSVQKQYAPNAALFSAGYGPERRTAGFLRSRVGGGTYEDDGTAFMKTQGLNDVASPSVSPNHKEKKFAFDQTANLAHIPVAKSVTVNGSP